MKVDPSDSETNAVASTSSTEGNPYRAPVEAGEVGADASTTAERFRFWSLVFVAYWLSVMLLAGGGVYVFGAEGTAQLLESAEGRFASAVFAAVAGVVGMLMGIGTPSQRAMFLCGGFSLAFIMLSLPTAGTRLFARIVKFGILLPFGGWMFTLPLSYWAERMEQPSPSPGKREEDSEA